ncbi:unnamed protein product [Caenorhabditis angaria]|uniref:PDZ domain-containing protein n=1 Tax=Caenorhabditis angaria TaxID=860376 RepID=A0A9P1N8M2_9PELO|nr:unnamed protein product [Caenorhabditis angaria]
MDEQPKATMGTVTESAPEGGHTKNADPDEVPLDLLPSDREKNVEERKGGFEYILVKVPMKPGLKFGLGIKNIYRMIYVQKVEDNSIVGGLFNVSDRIIDVDGTKVQDNTACKTLLIKGLKEKGLATVVVERAITEEAKKTAMAELNEEHNASVMVAPDVREIMKKMEQKIPNKPSTSALKGNAAHPKPVEADKRTVLEDGHKSVMIQMDNEDKLNKLQKVVKGAGN